jgi:triacylglycerol lipase
LADHRPYNRAALPVAAGDMKVETVKPVWRKWAARASWGVLGGVVAVSAAVAVQFAVGVWRAGHMAVPAQLDGPAADQARTRYPLVLVHGMMGFNQVGDVSYWFDIAPRLRAQGAQVEVTSVSAFGSSELRGEQLLAQVQAIRARTGADKVHIIGHSQGGQAARYVARLHPEWVASVTAVASPTMGSEVADALQALQAQHPVVVDGILALGNATGALINWLAGTSWPQDARGTLASLTSAGAQAFNQQHPAGVPGTPCGEGAHEVNGVRYYSWSGVGRFHSALNMLDVPMWLTGQLFERERDDNDGLVGRCASHLGEVLGDHHPMNHLHAVRMVGGLTPDPDPAKLFLAHAARLKAADL